MFHKNKSITNYRSDLNITYLMLCNPFHFYIFFEVLVAYYEILTFIQISPSLILKKTKVQSGNVWILPHLW